MVRLSLVASTAWLVFMTAAAGQTRPELAGKWQLVRDANAPDAVGAFGETFLATQYRTSLVIDWSFVAQGRGGKEDRAAHSAFILDGTESNVSDIYSGSSHSRSSDTSAWDGQKLVITTTWRGPVAPPHVTMKRTIWLAAEGTLIVETSKLALGGGVSSTTRSRYRRVGWVMGEAGHEWPPNPPLQPTSGGRSE